MVFKDVVVLIIELDVLQDNIDHADILPVLCDAVDQFCE
jgi:hypothetical protein